MKTCVLLQDSRTSLKNPLYVADDGKVVKAVSVIKDNWVTEEVILEELTVFQVRCYYRFVSDGEH